MVQRDQPREDRLLPDRQPDPVAVLQGERGLLVGEPELLGGRPHLDDVGGRGTGSHQRDGAVHVLAGPDVGVVLGRAGRPDREGAVVAGAVAVVAVQDVEERRVAGPDDPVGVDVRVRRAALARDRVDALDVLRAEVVERLGDQAHGLVLPHPGTQELVELVVGRVHHRGRLGQQARSRRAVLMRAGLEEHLLPVDDVDARLLQGEQDGQLDHVHAERLVEDAELLELALDLAGHLLGDPGVRVEGAPQGRDARPGPGLRARAHGPVVRGVRVGVHLGRRGRQPRVVELVVLAPRSRSPT